MLTCLAVLATVTQQLPSEGAVMTGLLHWTTGFLTRQLASVTSCWGLGKMTSNYRISPFLFCQGHNTLNMGLLPLLTMLS